MPVTLQRALTVAAGYTYLRRMFWPTRCAPHPSRACAVQSKLLNAPITCPTSGSCDAVLNSGYASVFGLPLPLLGEAPHRAASRGDTCWQTCYAH